MTNCDPILLVDDEDSLRSSLKESLVLDGYVVEDAPDAATALALVGKRHFPVVVTDLNLPGGPSGFDLIAAIKAHDPLTLCVVITGYASLETAVQAVKYGAYDFVQKPFKLPEIETVLNRALEHGAVLRELKDYQEGLEERVLTRLRELTRLHEEVLVLNDLLVAAQQELEEGAVLDPFLAHLRTRFSPAEYLVLLPSSEDDWTTLDGRLFQPARQIPPPSRLDTYQEWQWREECADGYLIPLNGGSQLLAGLHLGFEERNGFHPLDTSFVLWRRQVEAALLGLRRARSLVAQDRERMQGQRIS